MFEFSTKPLPSPEDYLALKNQLDYMKATFKQDGSWFHEGTGECKLCGGEIPYGHASYCDIWKMEKKIMELEARIKNLTDK